MQRFDLRDRLGLNGYGVLVRVVEDMQLGAVRRADPARLRAVVPKGQLALARRDGLTVADDGDLLELLTELARVRAEYEKVADALRCARESGYGIVMPSVEELNLEDPEIVRQGGRYGVRMKASAPSIHMIRADIETVVSPIVGNEKQSEDMVNYLMQEFEGDTSKIWNSNIFGRSFHEIVEEDLQAKLKRMPESAQKKLREALGRIINEGSGGLICIIL